MPPLCVGRILLKGVSHAKGEETFLEVKTKKLRLNFDLHDVHARLSKVVDEVLPHEEVKQLSRLGHHHLALSHVVQRLILMKT